MGKKKHHLTKAEEFQLMVNVFDKFLLLGIIIMAMGIWLIVSAPDTFALGFAVLGVGAILMIVFAILAVREFNFMQH